MLSLNRIEMILSTIMMNKSKIKHSSIHRPDAKAISAFGSKKGGIFKRYLAFLTLRLIFK